MKYEIINPSDKCFISAEDVRFAKIAGIMLGNGLYGIQDENGETVLHIFEGFERALGLDSDQVRELIYSNAEKMAEVFESFEYAGERTSLNNIEAKAHGIAKLIRHKAEQRSCV